MNGLTETMRRLEAVVGEADFLTATEETARYAVDGQMPVAVALPSTGDEVSELLRTAAEAKLSVLARGGGQHLYLGAPPSAIGLVLCLDRLNRMVEYEADDVTVTAEAGMSLGALQRIVGERGQMLPLDPPGPETATLGGLAAANLAGPMRMRYGAPRDLVIGTRVALPGGAIIRTGGRTTKNVAGYDLGKLFIGSYGTVGVLLELTLRLAPRPESRAVMIASLPPPQAAEVAVRIIASPLEVTACEVLNALAVERMRAALPVTPGADRQTIILGLAGPRESVDRQERDIRALVSGGCARLDGEEADRVWQKARGLTYPFDNTSILVRVGVPIARGPGVLTELSLQTKCAAVARVGDGLIYASPGQELHSANARNCVGGMRATAERAGGYAVLEAAPVELKRELSVWGEADPNVDLMRRLKSGYDPEGIMGCGRFLPGL